MPELTKQGLKKIFELVNGIDQQIVLQLLEWSRQPLKQGASFYQFIISDGHAQKEVVCNKEVHDLLQKEFPSEGALNKPIIVLNGWKGKKMDTNKIFIIVLKIGIEEKQIFTLVGQPMDYDDYERSNFQNRFGHSTYTAPKLEQQQQQSQQKRQPLKMVITQDKPKESIVTQSLEQSIQLSQSGNKGIQLKNQQKQQRSSLTRIAEAGNFPISPISTLYPMMMNFKIRARVIQKTQRKEFQSRQKEELLDESGQISGVFFSNACNKFFDTIEQGKIYTFQGGSIKQQAKRYSNNANLYQIIFEERTIIEEQPDDNAIEQESYNLVSIEEIKKKNVNEIVDVLGIVQMPGQVQKLTSKQGESLEKKTIILFDQSQNAIEVTFWRDLANNTDFKKNQIICIQNVKVSEYQAEKQLQNTPGTSITTNEQKLQNLDQYKELKQWYENFDGNIEIQRGASDYQTQFSTIQDIENIMQEKMNNSNDLEMKNFKKFVNIRAFVMSFLLTSKFYYPACQTCAKKAEQNGTKWSCQSCNTEFDEPNYRYILTARIQDHSGQALMTFTDNVAQQILNQNAKQFIELNDEEKNVIAKQAGFKEHCFLVQSNFNEYNGQVRPRYQISKIQEDNYLGEAKYLYKLLTQN